MSSPSSHSAKGPWNKSVSFIFPTKTLIIPQKFSQVLFAQRGLLGSFIILRRVFFVRFQRHVVGSLTRETSNRSPSDFGLLRFGRSRRSRPQVGILEGGIEMDWKTGKVSKENDDDCNCHQLSSIINFYHQLSTFYQLLSSNYQLSINFLSTSWTLLPSNNLNVCFWPQERNDIPGKRRSPLREKRETFHQLSKPLGNQVFPVAQQKWYFPTVDGKNPANHPTCRKPCKQWDIYHINWCRISSINVFQVII